MLLSGFGTTEGPLTDEKAYEIMQEGLAKADVDGKRVLILIPDNTRSCPMPMLFRHVVDLLSPRAAKVDFLIALGTHQPMSDEAVNKMLGLSPEDRTGKYADVGIYNHMWEDADTFAELGTIPSARIKEITGGLMEQDVKIGVNRMVLDYDQLMILGPTYPHEVVGFSGGLKYFFPGISDWEFINFFHWLGAVITCIEIIGAMDTPVRQVINEAAKFIPKPILNCNVVVKDGDLVGCYIGDPIEAWENAARLSDQSHIVYKEKPYKTVLGIAPEMYDDLWTAGKVMYKLEPIVEDGGELIIYAPHVTEISYTHGEHLDQCGYHVRDYFLKQMDKFKDVPGGVMAHSTHVRGLGKFEDGVEKPRITVTLATSIPKERAEAVSLAYRDYKTIDIDAYRNREDEGVLVVDHAGEVLHKLR